MREQLRADPIPARRKDRATIASGRQRRKARSRRQAFLQRTKILPMGRGAPRAEAIVTPNRKYMQPNNQSKWNAIPRAFDSLMKLVIEYWARCCKSMRAL